MKIGIVGLGLMGGSIAAALNQFHEVIGFDINSDSLAYAMKHQIIQEGTQNLELFFHESKIIFLCLYPHSLKNFIIDNQKNIQKDSILIEISGVKSFLIDELKDILEPHFELVYTHPIAGREKKGITFATKAIFNKANYVIVPTDKNKESSLKLVETLATEMGFKNISRISKEEHDDIISYTSQLTHVLSLALVNSDKEQYDTSKFIGDSYRDLTRISMINEDLWSELFLTNKNYLLDKINEFEFYLEQYKTAIESDNLDVLKDLMKSARDKRLKVEKSNQS